jgi:serine/threonine-protein phosphatase 2A regulatory subunit A
VIVKAMKDPIPNVRFTLAKIIKNIKPYIDSAVFQSTIVPGLKDLASDTDRDVAYFATVALND